MKRATSVFIGLALLAVCQALTAQDTACSMCHSDRTSGDTHSATDTQCTACHGDGSAHMTDPSAGGIIAFDNEPPSARSAVCLNCHKDNHPTKNNGHEQAGVACNDCHTIHELPDEHSSTGDTPGFQKLGKNTRVCITCHGDVLAKFNYSERHRLQENNLTCTSCHDPHEPETDLRLGSITNEPCAECHAGQAGPFVFEHQASRIDGCSACHTPHGSPNRHLLAHQQIGELCYSCHADVPQFHLGFAPSSPARFGADTGCTNCHATIHGSNIDRNFLK